jgi:hypothetical protein
MKFIREWLRRIFAKRVDPGDRLTNMYLRTPPSDNEVTREKQD